MEVSIKVNRKRVEEARENYSLPELIAAAATFNGSGEELHDFLAETLGMHPGMADSLVDYIAQAVEYEEVE